MNQRLCEMICALLPKLNGVEVEEVYRRLDELVESWRLAERKEQERKERAA